MSFGLLACGTVTSTSSSDLSFTQKSSRGLTYFLPLKLVNLTVSGQKLDEAKVKAKLDKAKVSKQKADEAVKKFKSSLDRETKRLEALTVGTELYEKTKGKIAAHTFDLSVASKAQSSAATELQNQTDNLNAAKEKPGGCRYKIAHNLSESLPDTGRKFSANPYHNILRDDVQKLTISKTGLLSTANVIADDRTDDIISEFAGALKLDFSGSTVDDLITAASGEGDNPKAGNAKPRFCPVVPVKFVYNPVNATDVKNVNDELIRLDIPIKVGDMKYLSGSAVSNQYPVKSDTINGSPDLMEALYYRTPVPVVMSYEVKIDVDKSTQKWMPASSSIAMLPQAGPVGYIPMRSSAFVKSVDDVTFDNGVVTSWNNESPSEVLELVRLPVKILSSIIAIPSEIISLKVDYSTAEANLAQSQAVAISEQVRSQTLLGCVEAAGDDSDAMLACLPTL